MLHRLLEKARVLSYEQAKTDVFLLAENLVSRYGSELKRFDYVAIPRGGTIVLGMLSYCLDLERTTTRPGDPDTPLVIVDDCVYSGERIYAVMERNRFRQRVVLALLYSTEEVRRAILSTEPSVEDCVSARNLEDLLPECIDDQAYRSRWYERLPGKRYWMGLAEPVAFPWSEPNYVLWNSRTGQVEEGWRFASPDRCLKNWTDLELPPRATQPVLRVPDKVVYRLVDDVVFLFHPDGEDVFRLEDTASLMWRALAAYGDRDAALDYLVGVYRITPERLRRDLDRFLSQLLEARLLEPTGP